MAINYAGIHNTLLPAAEYLDLCTQIGYMPSKINLRSIVYKYLFRVLKSILASSICGRNQTMLNVFSTES